MNGRSRVGVGKLGLAILLGWLVVGLAWLLLQLLGERVPSPVTASPTIPPYPPCPPDENGAGGCIAPAALGGEGLPLVVVIGAYTVRLDRPEKGPYPFKEVGRPAEYAPLFSIWRGSTQVAEERFAEALDPHTGQDVDGDGYPDAIVHLYTWGAHCCFATVLYSLGPELRRYVVQPGSNCQGEFRDLDGDGVYEFLTCDDAFAYKFCPFAQSPLVRVVLKFVPGKGYVPASPEFPEAYEAEIARHQAKAEEALGEGPFPDWDGTPKCAVLALVLDYLYSGQPDRAWEALARYYRYPDGERFRGEIEAAVRASALFTPPAGLP